MTGTTSPTKTQPDRNPCSCWPKNGEIDCWNWFACGASPRCPSWSSSCRSPSRPSAATWSTWRSRARPSGSTAACCTRARRPSCRTSTSSSRPQWEKKRAIARRAVELIDDGDTILLDGGSTTYEVARLLVGRPLHVVTNSLPVANLFAADSKSDLVLVGGNICPRTGVAQGPLADRMIASLRVRKTMLSVAGDQRRGVFQQQPAAGRDRAGDDAGGRRGDRRGRQLEVRPPEPHAPVRARRRRSIWSSTTALRDEWREQGRGGRGRSSDRRAPATTDDTGTRSMSTAAPIDRSVVEQIVREIGAGADRRSGRTSRSWS